MGTQGDKPRITLPVPAGSIPEPGQLRWGVVATVKAPLQTIARFVAWHLDIGASEIHLYLDAPNRQLVRFFSSHPAIRLTRCNERYWRNKPEKARSVHQLRQAFNASRAYRKAKVHWLAHIDVDEFILTDRPVHRLLGKAPADSAFVQMPPAEMLAQPDPWQGDSHFKLTAREAGLRKTQLEQVYPDYGTYVPQGFIGYNCGKNFARTGIPGVRLGIHSLSMNGAAVDNGMVLPGLHIGHAHAPSWEIFRRHFEFRMSRGSYRKTPEAPMRLRDVIDLVMDEDGEDGLRHFFASMCEATPGLLQRLSAHNMLLTRRLDLDEKVSRHFGPLPKADDQTETG